MYIFFHNIQFQIFNNKNIQIFYYVKRDLQFNLIALGTFSFFANFLELPLCLRELGRGVVEAEVLNLHRLLQTLDLTDQALVLPLNLDRHR